MTERSESEQRAAYHAAVQKAAVLVVTCPEGREAGIARVLPGLARKPAASPLATLRFARVYFSHVPFQLPIEQPRDVLSTWRAIHLAVLEAELRDTIAWAEGRWVNWEDREDLEAVPVEALPGVGGA